MEDLVCEILSGFASQHGLFLDSPGERPARSGKKVTWTDKNGNKHDLDFVLEKGGTPEKIGRPVAFIESAWRRYTKHSRNKAQEIQGALEPLMETYADIAPFSGVVLAGHFTHGAITQLKSLHFEVLHFSYPNIVEAFEAVDIRASYDEATPVNDFRQKIEAWERLPLKRQIVVADRLRSSGETDIANFLRQLRLSVERGVITVRILPLFGSATEYPSISEAIAALQCHDTTSVPDAFVRYEITVEYNNGDRIEGRFADKREAVKFLRIQGVD